MLMYVFFLYLFLVILEEKDTYFKFEIFFKAVFFNELLITCIARKIGCTRTNKCLVFKILIFK